jgi:hypothetical protein
LTADASTCPLAEEEGWDGSCARYTPATAPAKKRIGIQKRAKYGEMNRRNNFRTVSTLSQCE